ncbi:MAG: NYN domain-containing protein [Victivallales bacterium]|nr:NYN domain-containing protein [Victivallales bacterium]
MNDNDIQKPPIAVLIDADNVSASSVEGIFKIVAELGEPIVRRAYGMVNCFSTTDGWTKAQRDYGIIARPQVSNITHKNVADIALVIDAMSLLYKSHCQGICIVSSDSDFTALAARIREEGKVVYGIGESKTPESFRRACTEFFQLRPTGKSSGKDIQKPAVKKESICPRCGAALIASRTKSNQDCKICPACGGMTAKMSTLKNVFAEESLTELKEQAKSLEHSGCVCPECSSQMSILRVASGRQHVEIDVCPDCNAIWYDKDEFESLVPNDGLLQPTVSAGKAYRREIVTVLSADLRNARLKAANTEQLKTQLKSTYHVPVPDISPVISGLQCQKIISIDKAGKITVN